MKNTFQMPVVAAQPGDSMYRLSENSSLFLDMLRFFAVQLVVIGHGISFCAIVLFIQPPNFAYIQDMAVVLFFILSGFLISYSVFTKKQDKSYSFSTYFIDRFSRIFTGLVPAILFVVFLDIIYMNCFPSEYALVGYSTTFNLKTFFGNLLMLQDFPKLIPFGIDTFGTARPLWTLSIEWWIYMFFGWLILKDRIKINKFFYLIILLAFCIVPLDNFQGGRGNGLFLMWLFGAFTFLLLAQNYGGVKKLFSPIRFWVMVSVIGSFAILYKFSWESYTLLYAFMLSVLILLAIIYFDQRPQFKKKYKKPIHRLASYSYTLYLTHYSIFMLMMNFKNSMSGYALFMISFLLSNVCAFGVAYVGEMRYKSVAKFLKRRFLRPKIGKTA